MGNRALPQCYVGGNWGRARVMDSTGIVFKQSVYRYAFCFNRCTIAGVFYSVLSQIDCLSNQLQRNLGVGEKDLYYFVVGG